MQGSLPDVFEALPDLQFLALNDNPGVLTLLNSLGILSIYRRTPMKLMVQCCH